MVRLISSLMMVLALSTLGAAPARAQQGSPFFGSWAVDTAKLPIPPEQRPRSVTFTFRDGDSGQWVTDVVIIAADGSESHGVARFTPDGTEAPVQGSPEADLMAARTPRPDVLVMALSKGGVPGSIRIYAIDGDRMVETATYFAENGKPVMRTNAFRRLK